MSPYKKNRILMHRLEVFVEVIWKQSAEFSQLSYSATYEANCAVAEAQPYINAWPGKDGDQSTYQAVFLFFSVHVWGRACYLLQSECWSLQYEVTCGLIRISVCPGFAQIYRPFRGYYWPVLRRYLIVREKYKVGRAYSPSATCPSAHFFPSHTPEDPPI